jgi:ketosteroid isomerase-like protein
MDPRTPFDDFMQNRARLAQDYVCGHGDPLDAIVTRHSPATFFSPQGDRVEGAAEVASTYLQGAQAFDAGSESRLEVLHMGCSGELGYWVGLQHARVNFKGRSQAVPMVLRITEVFRREDGEWKLVHRHADPDRR